MSVNWNGYVPYIPPVQGLLDEMPPGTAREAFEHLMAAKSDRTHALRQLLSANGVALTCDDNSVQRLNDWVRANVEASPDGSGRLRNIWYAVVNDVALFLGDVMIDRNPGLRWEMFTAAKKDVSFQRHVLVGFASVPNPNYNVDIDSLVATYAYQAAAGKQVAPDYFLAMIRAVGARA